MGDPEFANDRTPLLGVDDIDIGGLHSYSDYSFKRKERRNISFDPGDTYKAYLQKPVTSEYGVTLPTTDIICIYVVAFDIRAGNVVEWHLPKDYALDGIEFKAMASGSHRVQTDFIYFKWERLFGLACFENFPVPNVEERGFRMKSVGVLATNFTTLHKHMDFLQQQVRHLLENPGSYGDLESYYEENKGMLPTFDAFCDMKQDSLPVPLMRITHPGGCFSQFMNFFGEQIFVLWKLALLRKRIIFYSPPPIGVVCYRVYSTVCLTAHRVTEFGHLSCLPFFYINIADVESLDEERSFIACTTEKIFESKTKLYDLYVDNQNLKSHIPLLQRDMSAGPADKLKFSKLCELQSEVNSCGGSGDSNGNDDELWFIGFFMSLNERLLSALLHVSHSQDRLWTEEHMRSVLLDPVTDRKFVMELADIYGIDIIVMANNLCCPEC